MGISMGLDLFGAKMVRARRSMQKLLRGWHLEQAHGDSVTLISSSPSIRRRFFYALSHWTETMDKKGYILRFLLNQRLILNDWDFHLNNHLMFNP